MRIGEASAAPGMTTKPCGSTRTADYSRPRKAPPTGTATTRAETITRLKFNRRGRAAGLTLAQISDILSIHDHGSAPAPITGICLPDNSLT